MKTLKSWLCQSLGMALMLVGSSKGSATSILNIDINSVSGGSQSQISWYFTGDIVSTNGEVLPDLGANGRGFISGILSGSFNGLFSTSFKASLVYNNPYNFGTDLTGLPVYSTNSGAYNTSVHGSGSFNLIDQSAWFPVYRNQVINSLSLVVNGENDMFALNFDAGPFSNFFYGGTGSSLSYDPSTDNVVIPVAFSSFNVGTYTSDVFNNSTTTDNPYIWMKSQPITGFNTQNFSTVVNVVPEPSTYALFGLGAIGMLMVMRRKKEA